MAKYIILVVVQDVSLKQRCHCYFVNVKISCRFDERHEIVTVFSLSKELVIVKKTLTYSLLLNLEMSNKSSVQRNDRCVPYDSSNLLLK